MAPSLSQRLLSVPIPHGLISVKANGSSFQSARKPLIHFRHGLNAASAAASSGNAVASAPAAGPAPSSQPPIGTTSASPLPSSPHSPARREGRRPRGSGVEEAQLPPHLLRRPLEEREIEAINVRALALLTLENPWSIMPIAERWRRLTLPSASRSLLPSFATNV